MITVTAALYLLSVAWIPSWPLLVFNIGMTVLLLIYADGNAVFLGHAWRLLRWLVFPVVILHGLFTPGRLYLEGWPFTAEGLAQGGWLALHLAALYLTAMLFTRLLSLQLVVDVVAGIPRGRHLIAMYIRLFPAVMLNMRRAVKHRWQSWRDAGHRVTTLPLTLIDLLQDMEHQARHCAVQTVDDEGGVPPLRNFRIPGRRALHCALLLWPLMLSTWLSMILE